MEEWTTPTKYKLWHIMVVVRSVQTASRGDLLSTVEVVMEKPRGVCAGRYQDSVALVLALCGEDP